MNCKIIYILLISLFLSSCVANPISYVKAVGPDTYTISVHLPPAMGEEPDARAKAMVEANHYCFDFGKETLVLNISSHPSTLPGVWADITFRCLYKGDPNLAKPIHQKESSSVIENQKLTK